MVSIWIWCSLNRNGLCRSVPMRSMASSMNPTTVEASGVNQPSDSTSPTGTIRQNSVMNSRGKYT
ncbi:hypothetical protein D3C72_2456770 [compost metagenome]